MLSLAACSQAPHPPSLTSGLHGGSGSQQSWGRIVGTGSGDAVLHGCPVLAGGHILSMGTGKLAMGGSSTAEGSSSSSSGAPRGPDTSPASWRTGWSWAGSKALWHFLGCSCLPLSLVWARAQPQSRCRGSKAVTFCAPSWALVTSRERGWQGAGT